MRLKALTLPPSSWDYFPHDHARSRAYRWGEDGLLGITDRQCRLCFALALWNEKDPILKVRSGMRLHRKMNSILSTHFSHINFHEFIKSNKFMV